MEQIPEGRNNTLVAESDLQAAYDAMNERIERSIQKDPANADILRQCVASLQRNLARVVQPVADEALHRYIFEMNHKDEDEENMDASTKELTIDDFDEEELIDPKAIAQLREARTKAKEQAARVVAIRQEVLDKAAELAQLQLSLHDGEEIAPVQQQDSQELRNAKGRLDKVKSSLHDLAGQIEKKSSVIPTQISALQETCEVVEKAMQAKETGTDKAIRQTDDLIDLQPGDNEVGAEERLASFLNQ